MFVLNVLDNKLFATKAFFAYITVKLFRCNTLTVINAKLSFKLRQHTVLLWISLRLSSLSNY